MDREQFSKDIVSSESIAVQQKNQRRASQKIPTTHINIYCIAVWHAVLTKFERETNGTDHLPTSIRNIILYIYATPIAINIKYKNETKNFLLCPVTDDWESIKLKIVSKFSHLPGVKSLHYKYDDKQKEVFGTNCKHHLINNTDKTFVVKSGKSRATATVELFATIFQKYLDVHKCEKIQSTEEELERFSSEMLDQVIIVGGFPRDIVLNRSIINDINIIINLRGLCKLQRNHLNKYHSKKEDQERNLRCVYWQRYLEKFNESNSNIQKHKNEKEMITMHNMNWIFNTSFWISILKNDKLLHNKLLVKDIPSDGFTLCQIVNTVKYDNVNLDRQCIDFMDTFSFEKPYNKDLTIMDFDNYYTKYRETPILSMIGINIDLGTDTINTCDDDHKTPTHDHKDFGLTENKHKKDDDVIYKKDEVPIYSGKVRHKFLNYDFSINTCIIFFSSIIQLKEYNSAHMDDNPMTFIEIVENGLGECDGVQDCQINKILKCPELNYEHLTIKSHPITFIFWRIIQWMIRDNTFKIDNNLIIAQINDYDNWLNNEWFSIQINCDKFMNDLIILMENCQSINDVKQMLYTMNILQFNDKFVEILNNLQNVRDSLIDSISRCNNVDLKTYEIIKVFQEYQYPIEQRVFKQLLKFGKHWQKETFEDLEILQFARENVVIEMHKFGCCILIRPPLIQWRQFILHKLPYLRLITSK